MSKVLVVDDSNTQRRIIAGLLGENNFDVAIATNGLEALNSVAQSRPDLIILDIVMPEMHGYEVCRRLKADPATQNIPIVFCSTKATQVDVYWGLKNGADAYLGKPFKDGELLGTLKQLLTQ
jgi:twitching motility two-component system response regulator PilH